MSWCVLMLPTELWFDISASNGKAGGPLAVLVFVHGEDFGWGAGHAYDPSMLASQGNIIVVTVSFRVGILGTFSTFIRISIRKCQ
jgi:para-nitrobenzyl esterase